MVSNNGNNLCLTIFYATATATVISNITDVPT